MSGQQILKRLGVACAFSVMVASAAASAADLPSTKEAPVLAPVVDSYQPFFVKVGVTYALNTSYSRLAGQNPGLYSLGLTGIYPAGVGANIGNVTTLGFEAGYYVTRNISIDVSSGIPFYAKVTTRGYNPLNPGLPNGTELANILPAVVPITAVYHFDFGKIRPFAGLGLAPGFSFDNKNAFLSNVKVGGAVGLVLQGGFDYMIDEHWGLSFDVKKLFSYVEAHANVINVPGVGPVPGVTTLHTNFDPWLFSTGLVYRFGASSAPSVVAKY